MPRVTDLRSKVKMQNQKVILDQAEQIILFKILLLEARILLSYQLLPRDWRLVGTSRDKILVETRDQ